MAFSEQKSDNLVEHFARPEFAEARLSACFIPRYTLLGLVSGWVRKINKLIT